MSTDLDSLIRGAIASTTDRRSGGHVRTMPQVSLMPAEISGLARGRRVRAALAGVVVLAVLATAGGVALATTVSSEADARAAAAQQRLSSASAQLAKFKDVQSLQQRIALGEAAQRVGSSTAIDWQRWIGLIEADLPAGFSVQSVQTDSATPFADYPQGTTPLDRPRAATVQLTMTAPSIAELPVWLRGLKSLPAYADATPTVTSGESGYTVLVTIHLTTAAYITPLKGNG